MFPGRSSGRQSSPSCWRCGANGRRTTRSTGRARRAEPAHCPRPLCQERALASLVLALGGQGLITGLPSAQDPANVAVVAGSKHGAGRRVCGHTLIRSTASRTRQRRIDNMESMWFKLLVCLCEQAPLSLPSGSKAMRQLEVTQMLGARREPAALTARTPAPAQAVGPSGTAWLLE